mgnify:CR=1 FL=1
MDWVGARTLWMWVRSDVLDVDGGSRISCILFVVVKNYLNLLVNKFEVHHTW